MQNISQTYISNYVQRILYAEPFEIVQGGERVLLDLIFKFVNAGEFSFVADAVQKTNTQNVAVEIAVEIENIAFNRRFGVAFKGRANADVCDASAATRLRSDWRLHKRRSSESRDYADEDSPSENRLSARAGSRE